MDVQLDSIENPQQVQLRADAYDLGAIRTVLAQHGIQFETPPLHGDCVVLVLPLLRVTNPPA